MGSGLQKGFWCDTLMTLWLDDRESNSQAAFLM